MERGEQAGTPRRELFAAIWSATHEAMGRPAPPLPVDLGREVPHMSEPWYCCAEPTSQQLQGF